MCLAKKTSAYLFVCLTTRPLRHFMFTLHTRSVWTLEKVKHVRCFRKNRYWIICLHAFLYPVYTKKLIIKCMYTKSIHEYSFTFLFTFFICFPTCLCVTIPIFAHIFYFQLVSDFSFSLLILEFFECELFMFCFRMRFVCFCLWLGGDEGDGNTYTLRDGCCNEVRRPRFGLRLHFLARVMEWWMRELKTRERQLGVV